MAKNFYTFEEMDELLGKGTATRGTSQSSSNPSPAASSPPSTLSFEEVGGQSSSMSSPNAPMQVGPAPTQKKWWQKALDAVQGTSLGFAKQTASFGSRLAGVGTAIGEKASDFVDEKRGVSRDPVAQTPAQRVMAEASKRPDALTLNTPAEKIGGALESVAEFLVPTPMGKGAITANLASKVPKLAKGAVAVGGKILPEVVEGVVKGAVTRGDLEDVETDVKIGALFAGASPLAKKMKQALPGFAKHLEKVNLRLTPTQKSNVAKQADDAASFILDNKLTGNSGDKLAKVQELIDLKKEPALQKFLKEEAKDRFVDKVKLLDEMESLKATYQDSRDLLAITRQIDEAKAVLDSFPDQIPLDRLNNFKRSTYENAFNRAGDKVLDDVEFAIANKARQNIEDATIGLKLDGADIGTFNKEYGRALNAKKFLKAASGRSEIGILGKLFSGIAAGSVGGTIGGPVGAVVGATVAPYLAEKATGTAVRSRVAQTAKEAAKASATPAQKRALKGMVSESTGKDENR